MCAHVRVHMFVQYLCVWKRAMEIGSAVINNDVLAWVMCLYDIVSSLANDVDKPQVFPDLLLLDDSQTQYQ